VVVVSWSLSRGLSPTPAQARSWLRQELQGAGYQSPWLDSLGRWVSNLVAKILQSAGHVAGLSPAITVLIAVAVIALLAWVLPRVRRERSVAAIDEAVLDDVRITPGLYRDLAAQALRDGRYGEAVVNGFRAIAKDMSDRGVLDDSPGRTAHEVSLALTSPFPEHGERLVRAGDLFDSVRYGPHRPDASQARRVNDLDAELARTRPRLQASWPKAPQI
jgi:Domain of unknown function (DUF4129)